jgi:uncharacterized membrane protein YfcA
LGGVGLCDSKCLPAGPPVKAGKRGRQPAPHRALALAAFLVVATRAASRRASLDAHTNIMAQQRQRRRPARRSGRAAALAVAGALLLLACLALVLLPAGASAAAGDPIDEVDPADADYYPSAAAAPGGGGGAGQQAATAATATAADPAAPSYPPFKWDWRMGVALASSVLIALVIAPGGSGGAQLYYPLFTVLLGFSVRDTAAVVSFVMFCGACISCGMAFAERHPTQPEKRALIDFGSVLVVAPAVLLGVAFGVILNGILPLWLLQAASVMVFTWAFIKIGGSLRRLRAKEAERLAAARALAADVAAAEEEEEKKKRPAAADVESGGGGGSRAASTTTTSPFAVAAVTTTTTATSTIVPVTTASAAAAALLRARSSGRLSTALTQRMSLDLARLASLDDEVAALGAAEGLMDPVLVAAALATTVEEEEEVAQKEEQQQRAASKVAPGPASAPPPAAHPHTTNPSTRCFPSQQQRLRRWAHRQPGTLILLTLLVLAQQLIFSVLQRSVVKPCSPGWYGVLGARVAVTVAIAIGAGVVVTRFNRRFNAAAEAASAANPVPVAPAFVEVVVGGGAAAPAAPAAPAAAAPKEEQPQQQAKPNWRARRASRRAARRARKQAQQLANHDAIQWRVPDMLRMNFAMLLIGVLGGCLGLGGGFAIAPLLLGMGLAPQPQAATSKAILLISTLASSASFLIGGRMPLTHALVFGAINVVVTPIGIAATNVVIRRTGRPSVLVILNAVSYAAGVVLLLSMSAIPGWIASAQGRVPVGFDLANLCPS